MNDYPKVSIVIPVYNGEKYIREAIDSALVQTYPNCEIIVINDGSIDDTENIVRSYGDKVKYYYKKNGGVASAVNMGLCVMEGEYFTWLSHDDIYYPQKVEISIKALKEHGDMYAPVYGRCDYLICGTNKVSPIFDIRGFSMEQLTDGTFVGLQHIAHGCTVMFHKDMIKEVGLFNENLPVTQDSEMWFRMFKDRKVVYIDEPLLKVRVHAEQDSQKVESFTNSCQELHMCFLEQIKEEDMIRLYGDKYSFYYERMEFFEKNKFYKAYEYVKDILQKLERPIKYDNEIKKIKEKLEIKENQKICLFCAGRNAKTLIKRLERRKIRVDYLSDNDDTKWNIEIEGKRCVSPQMVNKNDCIIVTKDYPEELRQNLKNAGYLNVYTYDDIKRELFVACGYI